MRRSPGSVSGIASCLCVLGFQPISVWVAASESSLLQSAPYGNSQYQVEERGNSAPRSTSMMRREARRVRRWTLQAPDEPRDATDGAAILELGDQGPYKTLMDIILANSKEHPPAFAEVNETGPYASTSVVRCIGGGNAVEGKENDPYQRACVITNVCWNGSWRTRGWGGVDTKLLIGSPDLEIGHDLESSRRSAEKTGNRIRIEYGDNGSFGELPLVRGITLYMVPTDHAENVGHVLLESIMSRWNSFVELLPGANLSGTSVNALYDAQVGSMQEKLTQFVFDESMVLSSAMCFESLIVGGQHKGGLQGNMPAMTFWAMRDRMHRQAEVSVATPQEFRILALDKRSSSWGHDNEIRNMGQLTDWLSGFKVNLMDPSTATIKDQVNELSQSVVCVSVWGGISMLNFLLPVGGVELVITTWDTHQNYISDSGMECPDFDRGVHNSYAYVSTVKYCLTEGSGSNGWEPIVLDQTKFMTSFGTAKSIVCSNMPSLLQCQQVDVAAEDHTPPTSSIAPNVLMSGLEQQTD